MNEADRPSALSLGHNDDLAGQLWSFDEFSTDEDLGVADLATGLTNVAFIRAALRRSARLWCLTAVIGFLAGVGIFLVKPPSFQASTSVLLTTNPNEQPSDAMLDNQSIAQSNAVAGQALRILGLHESSGSFAKTYSVSAVTSRVMLFTVKATSSDEAVKEANALAAAFLKFQANLLQSQDKQVNASLQQQINAAQNEVSSITKQISELRAQSSSDTQRDMIDALTATRTRDTAALDALTNSNLANIAATRIATTTIVQGSQVLDAARPIPQSRTKLVLIYAATGLIIGFALGGGIVIVRALSTDRLRRRDDVARVLGAPIRLSVGKVRLGRWRSARRGLDAAAWGVNVERVIAYLDRAVPPSSGGSAALAVVPVDDQQVAALTLVSLAAFHAQQGLQVVLADLCPGAPAARLLKVSDPGVHRVSTSDAKLTVIIPDPHDTAPAGPLGRSRRAQPDPAGDPLAAAAARADLVLTLAHLDPAVGGAHLASWAHAAVAVVTAGGASATRILAVGEMLRLAGTEVISGVLIGADKHDESLGGASTAPPMATGLPQL